MVSMPGRLGGITCLALSFFLLLSGIAVANPSGPRVDYISVSESPVADSTLENNASITGGKIALMNLNTTQHNNHWKAYVGNVSGSLVLEDAQNYSIFEWSIDQISGEVYATRGNSINWSTVVCANSSNVDDEMAAMNHTSTYTPSDAINQTFTEANNHDGFLAGPSSIAANSCNYTLETYVNGSNQGATEYFEEILLHDGTYLIYTTIIERDEYGYRTGETYDYQLLVAEKGEPEFQGQATSYYFYVELL